MQNKNTRLEIGLRVLARNLFGCGILLLIIPFPEEVKQYYQVVFRLGLVIVSLDFISKVLRFYRLANQTINAIWVVSILLILLGATMSLRGGGLGIAGVGIVAFHFTLGFSFFANRPEIK